MTISYISQKVKREINVLFWVTMGIFFLGFLFGRVAHAEESMDSKFRPIPKYIEHVTHRFYFTKIHVNLITDSSSYMIMLDNDSCPVGYKKATEDEIETFWKKAHPEWYI